MLKFAIGDIHGCYDELIELVQKCENYLPGEKKYIFLGDYIDRGPMSAQVLDWMMNQNVDKVCLMGNHEDMFLHYPADWMSNGGLQTVQSFKAEGIRHSIESQREWCEKLPLRHEDEFRHYVHAGFNPLAELKDQTLFDMSWIRDQFLHSDKDWGKLVIHGHTPYQSWTVDKEFPFKTTDRVFQIKPNRINLDTACVFGGHLTAAVFTDDRRDPIDFIQVARPRKM